MSLIVALTIHLLLRRARLPFVAEVLLLAVIFASLKPLLSPRPWLFSILFTAIELILIVILRRSWKLLPALLLPTVFVLWANLHIQFVYGLAILGFLALESIVTSFARSGLPQNKNQALSVTHSLLLLGSCLVATLVNPYHYGVYLAILEYVTQSGAFQNISELHPMFFRSLADWLVLSLTLTGAFILGWQRRWSIFYLSLFVMAACLAFRARRAVWFVALVVAVIVSEFAGSEKYDDFFDFTKERVVALMLSLLVCLYALIHIRDVSENSLAKAVELRFPVQAVKFIKSSQLPGPLYNSLDWGGYLIWSLPELPVAVDGRTNLRGDERIASSVATWQGRIAWEKSPELFARPLDHSTSRQTADLSHTRGSSLPAGL
jgi:fumarate reductase subunit C